MKNLETKLQNEAGLSKEQAHMAVGVFRDYLIESENDPDLIEALKVKAAHVAQSAKSKYKDLNNQAEEIVEKVSNTVNDMAGKVGEKGEEVIDRAKKKAKVMVDKLSKYLDD